jgi:hypothetical protein
MDYSVTGLKKLSCQNCGLAARVFNFIGRPSDKKFYWPLKTSLQIKYKQNYCRVLRTGLDGHSATGFADCGGGKNVYKSFL